LILRRNLEYPAGVRFRGGGSRFRRPALGKGQAAAGQPGPDAAQRRFPVGHGKLHDHQAGNGGGGIKAVLRRVAAGHIGAGCGAGYGSS